MVAEKLVIGITFLLGVFSGIISFFSDGFFLALSISIAIYFSTYLAFRSVMDLERFIKETSIGYFGLWFITWTLLINLL